MRLRTSEKGFVDIEKLELDRLAHIEEALKGNKDDSRGNLSVSMPISEIADFKYACIIQQEQFRVVIRNFCKQYVKGTDAIALDNAKKTRDFADKEITVLEERVRKEGDLVLRVIEKFVNEGVAGIETVITKGRYSRPIENINQVGFREILQIWDKIPIELRDPARPEDVRRCMKALEDRLAKVKNKTVRISALDQVQKLKHRELSEVFGEGEDSETSDQDKSIEELMISERANRQDNGAAAER